MIKLLVIAGNKTEQIVDSLKEKDTVEVKFFHDSLSKGAVDLQKSIVLVDKLVFIYQDDGSMNIKVEMNELLGLLKSSDFFHVTEILFFVPDTASAPEVITYFNTTMNLANYRNATVFKLAIPMVFNDIYDKVIGITSEISVENSYQRVYRAERNSTAKAAYEEEEPDDSYKVEPFSFLNLQAYEQTKDDIRRLGSSTVIKEVPETGVQQFRNPKLGQLDIAGLQEPAIFMVAGLPKSGVSVWSAVLAESTVVEGYPVVLFDFTDNQDLKSLLTKQNITFNDLSLLDMLRGCDLKASLNVCSVGVGEDLCVREEFVKVFFNKRQNPSVIFFIAASYSVYGQVAASLGNKLTKTIFLASPIEEDLLQIRKPLLEYKGSHDNTLLLLNDVRSLGRVPDKYPFLNGVALSPTAVKELFNSEIRIGTSIVFDAIRPVKELFQMMIEKEVSYDKSDTVIR